MKLTEEQKNQIYNKNMIVDDWEWVPCINHVLGILNYENILVHDENYEVVKWSIDPLIKDKNIRKAVRAWAYVNSINTVCYSARLNEELCMLTDMGDEHYTIDLVGWIPTLKDNNQYTIHELCGEEE